ncbi:hypothetical protein [Nonomuraea turcica]
MKSIARNKERLSFTLDLDEAVTGAEIAYICVDTPPSASGDADCHGSGRW